MPVTNDKPAPYAPAKTIIGIITRHRDKGLPSPVDSDVLKRAGIPESLVPRTLQALQTLDLLDENGAPSDVFEGIRLSPEAELKSRLADWLNVAYADALQFVDPATASETEVRDAFRSYKPTGQQTRMVSLFIALFAAAGIAPEQPTTRQRRAPQTPANASTPKPRQKPPQADRGSQQPPTTLNTSLPPALAGLMASLPPNGEGWTKDERDKFVNLIGPVIDFCYPIVERVQREKMEPDEESGDQS